MPKSYKERNEESIRKTGKSLYERRVESGMERGLSRSQARGHAREVEEPAAHVREYRKGIGGIIDRVTDIAREGFRLPPTMFPGRAAPEEERPGVKDEVQKAVNDAAYEYRGEHGMPGSESGRDMLRSPDLYSMFDDWNSGGGTTGWTTEQWMNMITEVTDVRFYEDDEGNLHYEIDFEWESEDGQYSGHGTARG